MHDEPQPTLRCGDRHLVLGARTYVMGVVNITPDSFSDGGRYLDHAAAVRHAHLLLAQGADVLDLGAESTRPGAAPVDEDEELRRLLPVVRTLVADGVRNLSIDTMKPAVARAALAAGAAWVNDVSGLADPELAVAAAEGGADALVVMHARAMSPGRIEDDVVVHGDLVVDDVAPALRQLSERAEAAGVAPGSIVVDPGIGFGKTVRHNLELLDRAGELRRLVGRPVLVGPSRKRFLAATAGLLDGGDDEQARDAATVGACCLAALRGADLVRVHDVADVRRALAIVDGGARR
ncbi:MAG: dihydropteroate synthase [Acidimicrobiia bacterium]